MHTFMYTFMHTYMYMHEYIIQAGPGPLGPIPQTMDNGEMILIGRLIVKKLLNDLVRLQNEQYLFHESSFQLIKTSFIYYFFDLIVKKKEINCIPNCTPFWREMFKIASDSGQNPLGNLTMLPQTLSCQGLLAFGNRSFAPSALAIFPTHVFICEKIKNYLLPRIYGDHFMAVRNRDTFWKTCSCYNLSKKIPLLYTCIQEGLRDHSRYNSLRLCRYIIVYSYQQAYTCTHHRSPFV